jgi:hypothetical protein
MAGESTASGPVAGPERSVALVWLDSREATVARWVAGAIGVEHVRSDVPPHRRSTGHVRHDPSFRHGGGGAPQTAGDPRRLEHLTRFLDDVAQRLPVDADLLLLGPGVVHERLARELRERDAHRRLDRQIRCEAAGRLTPRQLVARLRSEAGVASRRRTVGAYRWIDTDPTAGSGTDTPRRVARKPIRPEESHSEEVT